MFLQVKPFQIIEIKNNLRKSEKSEELIKSNEESVLIIYNYFKRKFHSKNKNKSVFIKLIKKF